MAEWLIKLPGKLKLTDEDKKQIREVIMGSGPKDAYERELDLQEDKERRQETLVRQVMDSHALNLNNAIALAQINLNTKRKIRRIVVHAAETYPNMDIGAKWVRDVHVNENKWRDIGYHLVIRRNGLPEVGRPIDQVGAHTLGFNNDSIGICLAGGKARPGKSASNYTFDEQRTLHATLTLLTELYPDAEVCGHHDLVPGRGCPLIDVKSFWYGE